MTEKPANITRRRFLVAGSAGVFGPIVTPLTVSTSSPGELLDVGRGFLGYVDDDSARILFRHLVADGFVESPKLSRLHVQTSGVEPETLTANVAWGVLKHPDGARALITHVVDSPHDSLRKRRPQAHIWEDDSAAEAVTVEYADGEVVQVS